MLHDGINVTRNHFQVAVDLDVTELLELYDFSSDAEHRQLSHVVLMELVIDR